MIKHDDGTIEHEVGDWVADDLGYVGEVVKIRGCEAIVFYDSLDDIDVCELYHLTPADPPAEQDGLYEIDEAIEDVEAGRTRTIDPDVGFVKEPAEPPKRTVKEEWEYAVKCAGIAAKHTTPDDLAEKVFVALAGRPRWGEVSWPAVAEEALAAAEIFRDAQQAQGGGE